MGRPINTIASRVAGERSLWAPALVIALVLLATATAGAEAGRITLKVTEGDILVTDAGVSVFTPSGDRLDMQARTNMAGIATFVVPARSYKFCVDHRGDRTWSHVVHALPNEETEVKLALEHLAKDKTLDPNPVRFDGTPPEKEPVMLASLAGLSGILTQSAVAAVSKDRLYWFVNDHLGTPMMIVDENQEIVWEGAHSPFGDTAVTANTIDNNFRFPGQYFDAESGLYYNYHRYYDPSIGRYLRADPIGLIGGMILFHYSNANPINWIDPFGLDTWRCSRKLGGPYRAATDSQIKLRHDFLKVVDDYYSFGPMINATKGPGEVLINTENDFGAKCHTKISDDERFDAIVREVAQNYEPRYNIRACESPNKIDRPCAMGERNCKSWVDDVIMKSKQKYDLEVLRGD